MNPKIDFLQHIYEAFNDRDADEVLCSMQPHVDWPNGWEGGRLTGHPAVRDYWLRQWKAIHPTVTPRGYEELPDGRILVQVHQHVVDPNGILLADLMVHHIYTFEGELVQRMDIEDAT
jgi:hypothetical protein